MTDLQLPSERGVHQRFNGSMHISARVDYALRALMVLVEAQDRDPSELVTADAISREQRIPPKFLENILRTLRTEDIVTSQRGTDGGFRLSREATVISVAEVIRALDGPLATVRGLPPEETSYLGNAAHLREVWIATRAALRQVLEQVSLADIAHGTLPGHVTDLMEDPGAWRRR